MITSVDGPTGEFHKRAQNDEERRRLVKEARLLEVARHPGVVHCLGLESETLRLRLVDGEALASRRPDDLVRVATMAATTLADLHDIGIIHGAVSGDHILVEPTGKPVLCSFGRGHVLDSSAGAARADGRGAGTNQADGRAAGAGAAGDVAGLARAVLDAGGEELPSATRQVLVWAAEAGPKAPSARRLATLLAAPAAPKRLRCQPKRWYLVLGGVAALSACLLVVAVRTMASAHHGPPSRPALCPAADLGCGPITTSGGVVTTPTGRYRIGAPGDVIVVGRWSCAGPLPALLEPGTGEVWAWRAWATGKRPKAAVFVTRVLGGLTLRVGVGSSGCDFLQVLRSRGVAVDVHPLERA